MSTSRRLLQVLSSIVILSMLFSGFSVPAASAQEGDGIRRQVNAQTGKLSFLGPESGRRVVPAAKALGIAPSARPEDPGMALAQRFGPEFGLKNPARDLMELTTDRSSNGRMTVRYQQAYQGIPVMGGELIVNTNGNGDLYSINGEISSDISPSTQPTVDPDQARQTALQGVAKWYEKAPEDFVVSTPELWIFDESLLQPSTRPVELVWRMEVTAVDKTLLVRELVLVNAQRGAISLHFNQIDTAWNTGSVDRFHPSAVESETTEIPGIQLETLPLYFDLVMDETRGWVYGSDSAGNKIDVIDVTTLQLVKSFTLVNGAAPKGMDLSPDAGELAVAQNGAGSVIFIDPDSGNGNTAVVGGKPFDVIYGRPDRLYSVGSGGTTDYVHVINSTTHVEIAKSSYAIYSNPRLAISSDKNYLYANMTYTDVIYKFDVTTDTIQSPVSSSRYGLTADYFILLPDDSKFVTDRGQIWSSDLRGQIGNLDYGGQPAYLQAHNAIATVVDIYNLNDYDRVIFSDASKFYTLSAYTLPIQGKVGPIAAQSDGNKVFISSDKGFLAVDLSAFPPGTPGTLPGGSLPYADLVIDEAHNVLYGSNTSGHKVDVISLATQQVIDEIRFNNNTMPMGMDLKPDGQELAVALNGGSSIAFVNTNTRIISATVIVDTDSYNVPFDVKYGRAGRLYSTGNPSSYGTGSVYILDTHSYTNVGKSNDLNVRSTPYLAVSPDNNSIYTIDTAEPNRLCRFDVSTDSMPPKTCAILYTYDNNFSYILLKDGSRIFTGNGQVWTPDLNAQLGSFDFLGHLVEIPGQSVIAGVSRSNPGTIIFIRKSDFYTASTYTMPSPGSVGPSTVNADGTKLFINTQDGIKAIDIATTSPISLSVSSGSPQKAKVQTAFNDPLKASIQNALGEPLSGVEVTFAAPTSGASGTFFDTNSNSTTAITDANGIATAPAFTANNIGGTYTIRASVPGLEVTANFQLTNVPPTISVNSGSPQSVQVLMPFTDPLKALVQYAPSEPIPGVEITFTAPASGASGIFVDSNSNTTTATTDANGIATAPIFIANNIAGSYTISITSPGIESSAQFQLANIPAVTCLIENGSPGGNTLLRPYKRYNCGKEGYAVGTGDFNKDGTQDVALSIRETSQDKLLIFLQDSEGVLAQPIVYMAGNRPESLAVGDLNNDGWDDIVTADFSDDKISVFLQASNGGMRSRITYSTGIGPGTIAVADVNNDALDDVVIAHGNAATISVFTQKNDGTLNTMITYPSVDAGFDDIAIGDVNNDGLNDVVKMNGQGLNSNLMVYLQNASGTLNPYIPYSLSGCSSFCTGKGLAIGDVTGDGRQDVVMSYGGNMNTAKIAVFPQGSDGNLQVSVSYPAYDIPGPVEIADMNSDGLQDVITAHNGWLKAGVLLQQNNGTLGNIALYPVPYSSYEPQGLIIGDINSDDLKDIVLADDQGLVMLYRSAAPSENSLIQTYTANNTTALPGTFLCDQSLPNCTNNANPHADAAHKYAIGTYNLYLTQHQRDSIDNNSMIVVSTVHYASGYANAGWTGSQMVYGDAYGFPLADDVVAHELTHGVTQYESNLFYYYQSGAINESFSDMWGEFYDQTNGQGNDTPSARWLMGEDVSGLGAIRSMSNPPAYGDPDKMSSSYYYEGASDGGGVHTNSGVNNKAVSLMVDGGMFNGKTVTGFGWEKTATIYYEANANLLASGADYSDLYYALQQACSNLIGQKGITSSDCIEVKDAIDAVEMNGQPAPEFNTDAPYCDRGTRTDVFSDGLESGTGNWTFTNGSYSRWQLDSPYGPYAHSGSHFLYANDYPAAVTDATARLTSFTVPSRAYLHFAQAYDFDAYTNYYDGGVLEYSIDGGSTWNDAGSLMDFNGYKGTIYSGSTNPLKGRSAFVGASHGYISTRLNLAPLTGKTVAFRWRMGLDSVIAFGGWFVDDVRVYRCIPDPVGAGTYDDTNNNWAYSGTWTAYNGSGPLNNTSHYTRTVGDSAELTFTGVKFILTYAKYPSYGLIDVFVDGAKVGTLNSYSSTLVWRATWASPTLTAGTHTVRLVHAGAAGKYIDLDAIEILDSAAVPPGTYDDADSNWAYSSGWTAYTGSGPLNNTGHYTSTPGSSAELTFTGTSFTLTYARYSNYGLIDVNVDGVKVGTIDTYSPTLVWRATWASPTFSAGTHTVRLVHAGPSGKYIDLDAIQILNTPPPAPVGVGTYEDTDSHWVYTGTGWTTYNGSGPTNNTSHYTRTVGDSAELTFTGVKFILTYAKYPSYGLIDVFVDGNKVGTINSYSSTLVWRATWASPTLTAGTHTVRLVHAGAAGKYIDLDAIEILDSAAVPPGTYDDADSNWVYSSGWTAYTASGPLNNTGHYTSTLGSSAELTFNGTSFTLTYARYSNYGLIDVYVDGVKVGTLDSYSPTLVWRATWSSPTFSAGTHTVRLVHAGDGTYIDIDAMTILP